MNLFNKGGILGAKGIRKAIEKNDIYIYPYNDSHINPNSVDLTLGNWFVRQTENEQPCSLLNPENGIWNEPQFVNDEQIFVIRPYEYILAHTYEIAGARRKYTTLLKARSTMARCGIEVCCSAGFGDVGYVNKWTLEIKNQTSKFIELSPRMRVCQLAFFSLLGEDKLNSYQGAYAQRFDFNMFDKKSTQSYLLNNYLGWNQQDIIPKTGKERMMEKQ